MVRVSGLGLKVKAQGFSWSLIIARDCGIAGRKSSAIPGEYLVSPCVGLLLGK